MNKIAVSPKSSMAMFVNRISTSTKCSHLCSCNTLYNFPFQSCFLFAVFPFVRIQEKFWLINPSPCNLVHTIVRWLIERNLEIQNPWAVMSWIWGFWYCVSWTWCLTFLEWVMFTTQEIPWSYRQLLNSYRVYIYIFTTRSFDQWDCRKSSCWILNCYTANMYNDRPAKY